MRWASALLVGLSVLLPRGSRAQADVEVGSSDALRGLQAVSVAFRLAPDSSREFSPQEKVIIERFQEAALAQRLQDLGLAVEEGAPLLECSLEMREAPGGQASWSHRVTLFGSPEPTRGERVWSTEGQGTAASGFLQSIPVPPVEEACLGALRDAWTEANPPTHGLERVALITDEDLVSAGAYAGRFWITGNIRSPGFRTVDPTGDATAPVPSPVLGEPDGRTVGALALRGGHAYVAGASGLQVFDVSEPSAPSWMASLEWDVPPGSWTSLALSGSRAVVSQSRGAPRNRNVSVGIRLVDVTDPSAPRLLASLDLPDGGDNVGDLETAGELVLVAARQSGLFVFDVTEPERPRLLSSYTPGSWSRGVAIRDSVAYLAVSMTRNASAIHVLDLSDPGRPRLLREIRTPGPAQRLAVAGDRLYVADHAAGLRIYDISRPEEPVLSGHYPTGFVVTEVAAADGLVAAWGARGRLLLFRRGGG